MTGRSPCPHHSATVCAARLRTGFSNWMEGAANLELRGVHADSEPSGARVAVVARQRHLAALIELARLGQGQRMCRNHDATEKSTPHLGETAVLRTCHR